MKAAGTLAELALAHRTGARLQPASGALPSAKGDAKLGDRFLLENKSTQGRALRIELAWLKGIEEQAIAQGRVPALSFQFTNRDGQPRSTPYVALPEWLFLEMADAYQRQVDG